MLNVRKWRPNMNIQRMSPETQIVMQLAKEKHWGFRVCGSGDMIKDPVYKHQYWLIPLTQNDSTIPKAAINRVEAIKKTGVGVKGVIVVHEAPKYLTAPKKEKKPVDVSSYTTPILGSITAGLTAFFTLFGYLFLLVPLLLIDPMCIVVLNDGTYVEVMRWCE